MFVVVTRNEHVPKPLCPQESATQIHNPENTDTKYIHVNYVHLEAV